MDKLKQERWLDEGWQGKDWFDRPSESQETFDQKLHHTHNI